MTATTTTVAALVAVMPELAQPVMFGIGALREAPAVPVWDPAVVKVGVDFGDSH